LILPAAILIEACVQWTSVLGRRVASTSGLHAASGASASAAAQPLGGLAVDGMLLVMRSPYLQAIALFTFLLGVIQTFLTFEQQHIVETAIAAKEARQEYFAVAENAAQTVTLLVQLFVTGALMRRIGVGGALLVLPIVGVLAFSSLGVAHTMQADGLLALVTVCTVAWRGLNNATLRPAREALYAPLSREEKYKAKSFSDTFAFRGGDLASAWSFDAFTLASAVFAAIPLVVAWGALGLWIGRRQKTIVNERAESDSAVRRQKI
jgi:AAA family ATP:ADP antiporter